MKAYVCAAAALVVIAISGCGGGGSPTAPTPPPPPPPVNIAGEWIGTFESQNYTTEAMEAVFQQVGATVNGTYVLPGPRVSGNLSGTVDGGRFIGQITFSVANICTIAGNIDGQTTAASIRWTSVGFATGTCAINRPIDVRITLQRR